MLLGAFFRPGVDFVNRLSKKAAFKVAQSGHDALQAKSDVPRPGAHEKNYDS